MPTVNKLTEPVLSDISSVRDIEVLVDYASGCEMRLRSQASFLVLSQLVVELVKQNRELSDRLNKVEFGHD